MTVLRKFWNIFFKTKLKSNPIIYNSDVAISKEEDDKFLHRHYASVLKDILLKSKTPINIGLFGKWGVGKSSVLHLFEECVDRDIELSNFTYVEIDVWGLTEESLREEILETINFKLKCPFNKNDLEDILYNVRQTSIIPKKLSVAVLIIILHVLLFNFLINSELFSIFSIITGGALSAFVVLTQTILNINKRMISKTTSAIKFNEIYKKIINKKTKNGKNLVVAFDNLDRCTTSVVIKTISIIQTFMVKPNCINILACDDQALNLHLSPDDSKYPSNYGNEFLNKFFQVYLTIPQFIGVNLSEYTESLLKKYNEFDNSVKSVLISGAVQNPRKINQFLNIAAAMYKLAEYREKDKILANGTITKYPGFLIKIIILKQEWPEFYEELNHRPELLDPNENGKWISNVESLRYKNKQLPEIEIIRLKKFLESTEYITVKDIQPFLQLSQKSYKTTLGIDKFEDAVLIADDKVIELFKDLDEKNQAKYIDKLNDMALEEYGDQNTLVNCMLSMIKIFEYVKETSKHMYGVTLGKLLTHLCTGFDYNFDLNAESAFPILTTIPKSYSNGYYNYMLKRIFSTPLNEHDLDMFLKYGSQIPKIHMQNLDKQLSDALQANEFEPTFLIKYIQEYNWNKNNIPKPSNTIKNFINLIKFNDEQIDIKYRNLYMEIESSINNSERTLFSSNIIRILKNVKETHLVPNLLLDYLETSLNEKTEEIFPLQSDILSELCITISHIIDVIQCDRILKVIFELKQQQNDISTLEKPQYFETLILNYVNKCDEGRLKTLMDTLYVKKYKLNKNELLQIFKRYRELTTIDNTMIQYLLKIKDSKLENTILEGFGDIIVNRNPNIILILLNTMRENISEFNSNLIQKIIKLCIKEAEDTKHPFRYLLYYYVCDLNPSKNDKYKITVYTNSLLCDDQIEIQNKGLFLLKKLNSQQSDKSTPIGINSIITLISKIYERDITRTFELLNDIYQYKDNLSSEQKNDSINLLIKMLQTNISIDVIDYVDKFIQGNNTRINEIIISQYLSTEKIEIKDRCKLFLDSYKTSLSTTQKRKLSSGTK